MATTLGENTEGVDLGNRFLMTLVSVNNPCKHKGDRKGRPCKRRDDKHICRGDLYGRPFCTDYLQKVKLFAQNKKRPSYILRRKVFFYNKTLLCTKTCIETAYYLE